MTDLKGSGYLISTGSVLLLGTVSWSSAARDPLLLGCLILGMVLSIAGMAVRWISHRRDRSKQQCSTEAGKWQQPTGR